MVKWLVLGTGVVSLLAVGVGFFFAPAWNGGRKEVFEAGRAGAGPEPAVTPDKPFLAVLPRGAGAATAADPIVIGECRLAVAEKEEVPSQRDGVILFIGTDLKEGEEVPPDRLITITLGNETKKFKRLMEDDPVEAGQLLAWVDDRVARDEWAIKQREVAVAKAELEASEKTREEARAQYETAAKLRGKGGNAISEEEFRVKKLTWEKYQYEVISKREAIHLAELKQNQARTLLGMHEIRSSIPGVVKIIYKNPGETVKSAPVNEPVLQIHNLKRLRVEGLVDRQHLSHLHKGDEVAIEQALPQGPEQTLVGHLQEVTGVCVAATGKEPSIVSCSLDGTVRVWDRSKGRERRVLRQPGAVRCVASRAGEQNKSNLCLSGGADGTARLWDLDATSDQPRHVLAGQHRGAINSVAFSSDGALCATGGDDRVICLWKTASGEFLSRLTGHTGAITAIQFTLAGHLVSCARDNTLRLWKLDPERGRIEAIFPGRSGDVGRLGVSPDGKRVLFDPWQSKALRILSLPEGLTEGILQNPSGAARFTTLALFSPVVPAAPSGYAASAGGLLASEGFGALGALSGLALVPEEPAALILTAGASEGQLQLWSTPTRTTRATVVRNLVSSERAATCAAFAPDGSFIASGSPDRNVLVWRVPSRGAVEQRLTAKITNIEQALDASANKVRIWAELDNSDGRLLPGASVTMVRYPR